jgi:hypothetical protein
MPLCACNQEASEEIKSTNRGNDVCTLSFSRSQTHTQTSASKMGQVKAVGVGWGGEPETGSSLSPRAHSPSWHRGCSSCRVGWDVRINIHLPMHMDNAHSCPACLVFIRTNCFWNGAGRQEGC